MLIYLLCVVIFVILVVWFFFFFFQAEDGIRDAQESRGLGDVYKRQEYGELALRCNMSTAEFKKLEGILRDSTRVVSQINKLQDRLSRQPFDHTVLDTNTEKECKRLSQLYDEAIRYAEEEDRCAARAIKQISAEFGLAGGSVPAPKKARENNFYDMPARQSFSAPKQPRPSMHLGASKSRPPANSDKPKKILAEGTKVACKIVQQYMEPSWILARIMEYVHATKKYVIKDEDETENYTQEWRVPWQNVVHLDAETELIDAGGKVLAIYPDSTTFYQATVVKGPHHVDDDYTLFFDGDQSQVRLVNPNYVFRVRD
eukprot:TRINITY_DN1040_c0_g1_i8.p1 TRINITY_DN1040_c0_g1~~TRINITY_DN1040_c0_g1_i8.p1  ORF type:complete len:315 (-),score=91.49 TRINITY_DN1040_c0_g1_i8:470-1414(-)